MKNIKTWLFKLFCILCPSYFLWMLLPGIKEFPPLMIPNNLNAFQIYVGASYWIGVLSAPGFLYFLFNEDITGYGDRVKKWIKISLYSAFYASIGGLLSIWFIYPAPFAIGTIACTYLVLKKYKTKNIPKKKIKNIETWLFKLFCIFCPSYLLWKLLPGIKEFPPLMITSKLNAFQIYVGASYWIGVLSAPGFLYFLLNEDITGYGDRVKKWVTISLYAAFYASIGGLLSIWYVYPAPFAMGTVVCTYLVLKKYKTKNIA